MHHDIVSGATLAKQHFVVMLTDGEDNESKATIDDLVELMQRQWVEDVILIVIAVFVDEEVCVDWLKVTEASRRNCRTENGLSQLLVVKPGMDLSQVDKAFRRAGKVIASAQSIESL